jgi:hypothetical protein
MLYSRMFFGGSFRSPPVSADSCPPDVSACTVTLGSHGLAPKVSPLFHSEDHAKRALEFQFSGSGDKSAFCAKPCGICASTKRARNSRRICTSIFIVLKARQNQHLRKTPIRPGSASRLPAKVTNRMSFHRLIKSNLSEGSLRSFSVFVAPTCPEFRGSFEGAPRAFGRALGFLGAPLFALCATSGSPVCNSAVDLCAATSAE